MNKTSRASLLFFFSLISVTLCVSAVAVASGREVSRCKYSVRDVAFVNVHGKSWQLDLIKPKDAGVDLAGYQTMVREKLQTSNLGFAWHEPDSQQAILLTQNNDASEGQPLMFLSDREGHTIPFGMAEESFSNRLDALLESPVRSKALGHLSESLCVFLLVKGSDETKNLAAKKRLDEAVSQIDKQMWTFEKAADKGPVVVEVDFDDSAERIALLSIGVDLTAAETFPVVAVLFGQARRMGELIPGEELDKQKLVALASICGSDCECALDRDWLYGAQMIHNWTANHERTTEENLDFDPQSAFVMAEIAQILQKNSGTVGGDNLVNLGAGLIIHDLPSPKEKPETTRPDVVEAEAQADQDTRREEAEEAPSDSGTPGTTTLDAGKDSQDPNHEDRSANMPQDVPWGLLGAMVVVILAIVAFRSWNQ